MSHERYLAEVSFTHPAQDIAFAEYRQAVRDGQKRVERLTQALRSQSEHWRLKPLVAALSSLRGIDFVAAVTLAAEIGDFSRFCACHRADGLSGLGPVGVLHR
jgi:transposase